MPLENETESVATTEGLVNKPDPFKKSIEIFRQVGLLGLLETSTLLRFSAVSVANLQASADSLKERLLTAVINGDEDSAREIVSCYPNLLLNSSTFVKGPTGKITYSPIVAKDLSGKIIQEITPLQAAICAGDVDMAKMLKGFMPADEVLSQFEKIYPNGIDAVETEQKRQAQEFKDTKLLEIFIAINTATSEQVKYELDDPGQHNADSPLNTALHNFRKYFADKSKAEGRFNPYDLLAAFEFYDERFDNFRGNTNSEDQWNRRTLFWRQVIGYTQRHLPACYLQAFAQGIYYIVENREKLKRDFEFKHDKGFYMCAVDGDLNNLGYKYAIGAASGRGGRAPHSVRAGGRYFFKIYCEQKNQVWRTYAARASVAPAPAYLPTRCVIA